MRLRSDVRKHPHTWRIESHAIQFRFKRLPALRPLMASGNHLEGVKPLSLSPLAAGKNRGLTPSARDASPFRADGQFLPTLAYSPGSPVGFNALLCFFIP